MTTPNARPCPRCGSTDAVRVLYGYPSSEMAEAERRGEVVLGGCMIWPESPDYECRDCGSPLPWVAADDEDLGDGALAIIRMSG
jgi:hypothetical protein